MGWSPNLRWKVSECVSLLSLDCGSLLNSLLLQAKDRHLTPLSGTRPRPGTWPSSHVPFPHNLFTKDMILINLLLAYHFASCWNPSETSCAASVGRLCLNPIVVQVHWGCTTGTRQSRGHFLTTVPGGSVVKNLPANAGDTRDVGSISGLGWSLEKEMATHSSILAWKIPWTEDLGLQAMGWQRVRHDWICMHTR